MSHVRDPELGSPELMGNRPLSTAARVAALDCLIEELGATLPHEQLDLLVDYVAVRFERGEVEEALASLQMATDRTGAYRVAAVLHTAG